MSDDLRAQVKRHDRWVNLTVIGIVAAALLLGWRVKVAAENRSVEVQVEAIKLRYPEGWVRAEVEPPVLLQVQDRMAKGFATALSVQRRALPLDLPKPLAAVHQTLTLERARLWNGYRQLGEEPVTVDGRAGTHVTFAYVETNPNPFLQTLPVVMRGEDYLFQQDTQAYIFTLTAAEANYARAHQALLALARSW
jgi:hypothetical protein